MSMNLPESGAAASAPIAMSVEELENVTGGSLGGLLEGVGKFVSGDALTMMSIAGAPESGFTSLLGTPIAVDDLIEGANEMTANL